MVFSQICNIIINQNAQDYCVNNQYMFNIYVVGMNIYAKPELTSMIINSIHVINNKESVLV